MAVPIVADAFERERAMLGARRLAGYFQRARFEAFRRATTVAVKLDVASDRTTLLLVADGNGNGVQQREIDAGVDLPIGDVEHLDQHARGVSLRINQTVTDIGSGSPLTPGDDPLRIGRTSLVAFSPIGSSTGGTIYVAAERGPQLAIRMFGATGRLRVLMFNAAAQRWDP